MNRRKGESGKSSWLLVNAEMVWDR